MSLIINKLGETTKIVPKIFGNLSIFSYVYIVMRVKPQTPYIMDQELKKEIEAGYQELMKRNEEIIAWMKQVGLIK
jgi:hypothetical protein